jgi:SAM-dependent methyltransferase
VDPKYGERYRELYQKHWWWRARTDFVLGVLRRLQPRQERETILDIGCGDGLFFDRLSQFGDVEGVESCPELVSPDNIYRDLIHVCPFNQDFQPAKRYSLILMLDVLEHFENPVSALRHAVELLSQDGMLLITVPAFMTLWTNHDVLNHHFTRYTKSTFLEVARKSFLEIREARYFYHWTCPMKLGQAFGERVFPTNLEPPRVPPGWINETFYRISKFEQKTLTRLPMPFGSSLMAVGAKGAITTHSGELGQVSVSARSNAERP